MSGIPTIDAGRGSWVQTLCGFRFIRMEPMPIFHFGVGSDCSRREQWERFKVAEEFKGTWAAWLRKRTSEIVRDEAPAFGFEAERPRAHATDAMEMLLRSMIETCGVPSYSEGNQAANVIGASDSSLRAVGEGVCGQEDR